MLDILFDQRPHLVSHHRITIRKSQAQRINIIVELIFLNSIISTSTTMGPENGKCYIINLHLMKITGLYQLLNPNTSKLFGVNFYKLSGSISVLYLSLVMVMCNISVYYSLSDFAEVVKYLMLIIATLFALIKMYFIIRNSDALWEFVGFTSIDLLPYGGHQRAILVDARSISIRVSKIITSVWVAVITIWILSPIIINGNYINVKSNNGTYNRYRYNMLNLLFPVSDEFYNENFKLFYLLETVALLFYGYSMMSFDYLVISMCITITYQLKTIAMSYSTLGYDSCFKSKLTYSNNISNINILCVSSVYGATSVLQSCRQSEHLM